MAGSVQAARLQEPVRMAQIDIDALYDRDSSVFAQNIQRMLSRMAQNRINVVALQAFADLDGDGNVDQVYFYNREVPVAANVFNTVAEALQRNHITVVAWLPGLTYQTFVKPDGSNLVKAQGEAGWYRRLSPFDPALEPKLLALYRDLSKYTVAQGILFQDDLYMNDFEDYSMAGQKAYQAATGKSLMKLDKDADEQMKSWTSLKTNRLTELSLKLAAAFKENCPDAVIMRDIYSEPVLNPKSEEWFAQNYRHCLADYDYTVVMAYPYMDKEKDPMGFLTKIEEAVKRAGGEEKTILKIQSYDWDKKEWLKEENFNEQIKTLQKAGARNIGYYPDTPCRWKSR